MRAHKPKILFHYSRLNIGGAERSTTRLVNALASSGWDVTLVLNVGGGSLESTIDTNVNIIHFFPKSWKERVVTEKSLVRKTAYLGLYTIPILYYTFLTWVRKYMFKFKSYDAAIISLQGLDPTFVCHRVNAKKKFLYLRSDLNKLKKEKVRHNIIKFNEDLDGYLCVSGTVRKSLDAINPLFKKKAHVLYNIIGTEAITALGNKQSPYGDIPTDTKILVTACRMSDASKGIFRQLEVIESLVEARCKFKWFFVGDGEDLKDFKTAVKEKSLHEYVICVGKKENPYPFIKNATLVAVLSYYEGLSGVVNEAKILGKAVIATEFSGIHEQIIHGENGYIVQNNQEAITLGLKELLSDDKKINILQNTFIGSHIDDNDSKIRKLQELILE